MALRGIPHGFTHIPVGPPRRATVTTVTHDFYHFLSENMTYLWVLATPKTRSVQLEVSINTNSPYIHGHSDHRTHPSKDLVVAAF